MAPSLHPGPLSSDTGPGPRALQPSGALVSTSVPRTGLWPPRGKREVRSQSLGSEGGICRDSAFGFSQVNTLRKPSSSGGPARPRLPSLLTL